MSHKSGLASTGVRFLISLPFLAAGIFLLKFHSSQSFIGILPLLIGTLLLISPVLGVITRVTGSIFYPATGRQRVNLMLSIPEARIMEGKYEEALELFKEMIPKDPKRLEIYMRIMDLAVYKMHKPGIATETFKKGLKKISDRNDRKALRVHYKTLIEYPAR